MRDLQKDLDDIDWSKFSFHQYRDGELNIIKPQLETLGWTNIEFWMEDYDSFGPLSRAVSAQFNGEPQRAIYG